ncbi:MAG: exo-alpha-sialidase [Chloroflexi bacterium]|nr:MAG: exo-alpha-sialidase [Chloroflexota bacterium]
MRAWRSWRAQLAAVVLIFLASGVALAIHLDKPARRMAAASPSVTFPGPLPPFPDCTKPDLPIESFPYVSQQTDGGFSGCVRVDQANPGSYSVIAQGSPHKCCASSATASREALTVSPPAGPPGTLVTITGTSTTPPSAAVLQKSAAMGFDDHAQVCWVACDVLSYSDVVKWSLSSTGNFEIAFQVPSVPWMTAAGIQRPVPGGYRIVLPCIPDSYDQGKGCKSEQLTGSFQMTGPVPSLCDTGQPCSAIEVSPTQGPPGSIVAVRGWTPLVGLGGQALVYLRVHTANTSWDSMPTLASTSFEVTAQPDWASLGTLHPLSILRSGLDAFGVDPANPHRFAYCSGSAIQVTADGGQTWSPIPIQGVVSASAATKYPLGTGYQANPVSCDTVALDPQHPTSFYALFLTADRAPPPMYYVGYFTNDAGRTWYPVPVPAGSEMRAFGGFRVDLLGVRAVSTMWSDSLPPDQPMVAVEVTVDGGNTWTTGNLACPQAGPCVALGSKSWARCMAVEGWEAVLVSTDNGKSWSTTNHIRSCWRVVQVVGLANGRLVTLDGRSQFPLTVSDDGDRTSRSIALPALPNQTNTNPDYGDLELLPDGRLLLVSLHWYVLAPGASAWCSVANSPTGNQTDAPAAAVPQLIGDHLWWLDGQPTTLRSLPVSALHC